MLNRNLIEYSAKKIAIALVVVLSANLAFVFAIMVLPELPPITYNAIPITNLVIPLVWAGLKIRRFEKATRR